MLRAFVSSNGCQTFPTWPWIMTHAVCPKSLRESIWCNVSSSVCRMINKIEWNRTGLQLHQLPGTADCHAATNFYIDQHAGLHIGKHCSRLLSQPLAAAFDDVVFSLNLQNLNLIRAYSWVMQSNSGLRTCTQQQDFGDLKFT